MTAIVAGCAPISVWTEHDPGASYEGLRTWDWAKVERPQTGDPRLDNPLLYSRIESIIESELTARGYPRNADGAIDFLVGYHVAVRDQTEMSTFDDYYGYRPLYSAEDNRRRRYVYVYEQGTLVLDVVLPEERKLVWRAFAEAEVDTSQSQDIRDQRIREAVRRMLDRFPPGGAGAS